MAEDVALYEVKLTLCALCVDGSGGECHVPGCALYMNRAPDTPLLSAQEQIAEASDDFVYTEEYVSPHPLCCDVCKNMRVVMAEIVNVTDKARAGHIDAADAAHQAHVLAVNALAGKLLPQDVRNALAKLVELKDGPRDENYEREKPLAWQAARDALAGSS